MPSGPQVSIVIPCFNQGHFLAECLASLLSQSFGDWEAIVVDDASADADINAVVEQLHDDRCRVVQHTINRGQGAARNTGFREARASLVVPVDSDDILHPDFLSTVLRPFHDSPMVDGVFTDFHLFGLDDEVWHYDSDLTLRDMLLAQWIPGAGTAMRRSVWERVQGYCEERALVGNEDWDFWISALSADLNVVHIPLPLYLYRKHEQSVSAFSIRYDEHRQRELLYRRHKALYDQYQLGGQFRAVGYFNSAVFSWQVGERRRAVRLAGAALRIRGVARPFLSTTARASARRAITHGEQWRARVLRS